jgi:esterase/lipase
MFTEIKVKDIALKDNKTSSGVLLKNEVNKNNSIIICAHGLGGSSTNYMNLKLRDYIVENNLNFDTFRFNFYTSNDKNRSFLDTTISSQMHDLESIIEYFSKEYENVYLMATSYGALTAAALNSQIITKQILVDPSFIIDIQWQHANNKLVKNQTGEEFNINFDNYVPRLYNKAMELEGLAWNSEKSQQIIHNIAKPTFIIQANSIHHKMAENLDYSNPNIITEYIECADHSFTRINSCNIMLNSLFNFLK